MEKKNKYVICSLNIHSLISSNDMVKVYFVIFNFLLYTQYSSLAHDNNEYIVI